MLIDRLNDGRVLFVMAADQEYGPELRRRIRPLFTGVGPIESAVSTSLELASLVRANRKPDFVVSLGSAGSRSCQPGTIWQIATVSWRDMDATALGFEKGVTPFADHAAAIPLLTPFEGIPSASLSTGSKVLNGDELGTISEDLVDMETFAIVRACQRFQVPVIGLRGVSDGSDDLRSVNGWTDQVKKLDTLLALSLDELPNALTRLQSQALS